MLIQNNNSNIFINNKNNTFTSNSRKVNLPQLASQNKDMLFLSFRGSMDTSKQNTQDKVDKVALTSKLTQELADLESQLFDDKLFPSSHTLFLAYCVVKEAVDNSIKLKIDPEKYLTLTKELLTKSKKQPDQNHQSVSEQALNLLRAVYLLVDDEEFENKVEHVFLECLEKDPPGILRKFFLGCFERDSSDILKNIARKFFLIYPQKAYSYILVNNAEKFFKSDAKSLQQLNKTVAKANHFEDLKSSEYLKARYELFQQEFTILYQELTEPDKYLLRANVMGAMKYSSDNPENLLELQLKAIRGIKNHLLWLSHLNIESKYIPYNDLAGKCTNILNKKEDSPTLEALKIKTLEVLYRIYNFISPENKEKLENIAIDIIKSSSSMEMKKWAISLFATKIETSNEISKQFVEYFAQKLDNKSTSEQEKITALTALAQLESYHTSKLISNILSDNSTVKKDKIAALIETKRFSLPDSINLINNMLSDNSITTLKKTDKILNLTQYETPFIRIAVEDILNDSNSSHSLKMRAVWAAGLDHTDKNFKLLLNIINPDQPVNKTNTTNEKIELKEMALYSLAEFGNKDVKSVLEKIAASKSELSEQACALIEKNNPKYYDEGLIKELLNNKDEQDAYKKLRNEYVLNFEKFPSDHQYWTDKALIPFRTILKEHVSSNSKLVLINDTPTAIYKDNRGIRSPYGLFIDTAGGEACSDGSLVIPGFNFCTPSDETFIFGHEWGHQVLFHIKKNNPKLYFRIKKAYNEALKENKCLNSYAAQEIDEYFADGNEAYLSIYKPHYGLINSNDYESGACKTRYILKRKDPKLYNLIEEVYKYYNKQNITGSSNSAKPLGIGNHIMRLLRNINFTFK